MPRRRAWPLQQRSGAIGAAALALWLQGCNSEHSGSAAQTSAGAAQLQVSSDAGLATAQPPPTPNPTTPIAPAPSRSDPACMGPLEGPASRVTMRPAHGQLVLGVLAGLKDASDDNLTHLRALVAELRHRGAELLIADGDVGDNSDSQEELLTALASGDPPLPILVVAGNREVRADLDAAEAAVRKRGVQLVDLSHTRVVDLGDALVVAIPGVFERRLLRADGACMYAQTDLDALAAYLDKLPATAPPALMVAAVPPRGDGAQGLDYSDGQGVGEMRFIPLLTSTRARFGVFGQVWEAGGHAVDAQGRAVPSGQLSNQLYVNPGAADMTPWPMNDGTTSRGLAALVTIRARQASFEPIREPVPPARSP